MDANRFGSTIENLRVSRHHYNGRSGLSAANRFGNFFVQSSAIGPGMLIHISGLAN